jgi:ATP-dependent Clp protease ATP-binding subunit ClpA
LVKTEDVEEVVHRKTEIPVGEIALAEKQTLLHLEKILHRRVIGQDEAIVAIANAMRRSRSGIASEKKPIGSFLFMGPTGVGKTETAKTLAQVYFGSEKRMLRFDMSEYQNADSLVRIIGGGSERGILTREVIDSPFSLLLLDEIEKAHPDILNLFLQVLDDGRLTDNTGRTVDFTNTIIIATSNAGAELIRQSVKEFRDKDIKERLLDYLQKEGLFRPEFLNRFDALIIFKPLTEDQTGQVAELMFNDLNRRLKTKEIQVNVTPELIAKVSKLGYSPEYGARPLRRVIQDKIEDIIAKKLLSGEIQRGQTVTINHEELV